MKNFKYKFTNNFFEECLQKAKKGEPEYVSIIW